MNVQANVAMRMVTNSVQAAQGFVGRIAGGHASPLTMPAMAWAPASWSPGQRLALAPRDDGGDARDGRLMLLCDIDAETAMALVARSSGARMASVDGSVFDVTPAPRPAVSSEGCVRVILFTDIERSTALTQRVGDQRARMALREHDQIVREALVAHGGVEVKSMGDGFMASFASARRALECAVAMQRAFAAYNETAEEPLQVRMGINAGEPIEEDDPSGRTDLFGTAVIMAARLAAKAAGSEILASDVVRQLVAGKGFRFADHGEVLLKGFEEAVRLFSLRWRDEVTAVAS
jgi:class 3 adenylate cyclase